MKPGDDPPIPAGGENPGPTPAVEGDPIPLSAENPWPGLNQFLEDDGRFFHGRDDEKGKLFHMVKSETLTTLFGKSGLGKSSLLRAGLSPLLRKAGFLPVYIHLRHDEVSPTCTRGGGESAPLRSQVYTKIREECHNSKVEAPEIREEETLWEYFQRTDALFWDERNRIVTPVLVFDQFEEFFTLGSETETRRRRREAFIKELEQLIENRPPRRLRERWEADHSIIELYDRECSRCKIVLSLREDFLPELEQLRGPIRSIMNNRFRLSQMNGEKAWRVVNGEEENDGELSRQHAHLIDEAVALQIIDFVSRTRSQRGSAPLEQSELVQRTVDPALLSVVCSELNARRLALQEESGQPQKISFEILSSDKDEIIETFFDKHVTAIGKAAEPMRRFIENELITGGGFRKRCDLGDALAHEGVTEGDLRTLERQRLLRIETSEGAVWIELTHDILTDVVYRSRNEREREEEKAAERELSRQRLKTQITYGIVGVLAVGAAAVALFLIREKSRGHQLSTAMDVATEAKKQAELRQKESEKYLANFLSERIQAQLSEDPPNHARAHLVNQQAVKMMPETFAYGQIVPLLSEAPLFAPAGVAFFKDTPVEIAYAPGTAQLGVLSERGSWRLLDPSKNEHLDLDGAPELFGGVSGFAFHPGPRPIVALRLERDDKVVLYDYQAKRVVAECVVGSKAPSPKPAEPALASSHSGPPRSADRMPVPQSVRPHERELEKVMYLPVSFSAEGDYLVTAAADGSAYVFNTSKLPTGDQVPSSLSACAQMHSETADPSRKGSSKKKGDGGLSATDRETRPTSPATALAFVGRKDFRRVASANSEGFWTWTGDGKSFAGSLTPNRTTDTVINTRASQRRSSVDSLATSTAGPSPDRYQQNIRVSIATDGGSQGYCIAPANGTNTIFKTAFWTPFSDVLSERRPQYLNAPSRPSAVAYAPDAGVVATGCVNGSLYLFRETTLTQRIEHGGPIVSLAFRQDGLELVSASSDRTVKFWSLTPTGRTSLFVRRAVHGSTIALGYDGQHIAVSDEGYIRLHSTATGKELSRRTLPSGEVVTLAVTPKTTVRALIKKGTGSFICWDTDTRQRLYTISEATAAATLSPDGQWMAALLNDGTLRVINATSGSTSEIALKKSAPPANTPGEAESQTPEYTDLTGAQIAFSQDGTYLAVHDPRSSEVSLWMNPLVPFVGPINEKPMAVIPCAESLTTLAFYSDLRLLLATTNMGELLVLDTQTARQALRRRFNRPVHSLAVNGAGTLLACEVGNDSIQFFSRSEHPNDAQLRHIAGRSLVDLEWVPIPEKQFAAELRRTGRPEYVKDLGTFWKAFWQTSVSSRQLKKDADLLAFSSAFKPLRDHLAARPLENESSFDAWQVIEAQTFLDLLPPWGPPSSPEALHLRLLKATQSPAVSQTEIIKEGVLPFAQSDRGLRAEAHFRLGIALLENSIGSTAARAQEDRAMLDHLKTAFQDGFLDVHEIIARTAAAADEPKVEIINLLEQELLPRLPAERVDDRTEVLLTLASSYAAIADNDKANPAGKMNTAIGHLRAAVGLGFDDWGDERLGSLQEQPDYPDEWRSSESLLTKAESGLDELTKSASENALSLLDIVLRRSATNQKALLLRVRALRHLAQFDSAQLAAAQAALSTAMQHASSPEMREALYVEEGELRSEQNDFDGALKSFDAALAAAPGSTLTLITRAVLWERLGRWSKAAEDYKKLAELDSDGDHLADQARVLFVGGPLSAAEDAISLMKQRAEEKDDSERWLQLGDTLMKAASPAHYDQAIEALSRARSLVENKRYNAKYLRRIREAAAATHFRRRDSRAAFVELDEITKLEPEESDAWRARADVLLQYGRSTDINESLRSYRKAISLATAGGDSAGSELYNGAAWCHLELGEIEEAFRQSGKAVSAGDNWALITQANILVRARRYTEGIDAFKTALKESPRTGSTWLYLGFALFDVGKYDEAIEALRKAVDLDASYRPQLVLRLAYAGRFEDAKREAATLLAAGSLDSETYCEAGRSALVWGDVAAARGYFKAATEAPVETDRYEAVWALTHLGNFPAALTRAKAAGAGDLEGPSYIGAVACVHALWAGASADAKEAAQHKTTALLLLSNYFAKSPAPNWPIKDDIDLAPLRKDPAFQRLLGSYELPIDDPKCWLEFARFHCDVLNRQTDFEAKDREGAALQALKNRIFSALRTAQKLKAEKLDALVNDATFAPVAKDPEFLKIVQPAKKK